MDFFFLETVDKEATRARSSAKARLPHNKARTKTARRSCCKLLARLLVGSMGSTTTEHERPRCNILESTHLELIIDKVCRPYDVADMGPRASRTIEVIIDNW